MLFTARTSYDEVENPAFYRRFQWSVVGKANNEVKRQRRLRKTAADPTQEEGVITESPGEKDIENSARINS